jgi:ribosomal protein L16 Arg81 hydroxylase
MIKSGDIETVVDFDIEFFNKEFIQKNKPAIIKGAAKNWPAFLKWDAKYLVEKIGNEIVKFKYSNTNLFPNPDKFQEPLVTKETTLTEYINLLLQNNKNWIFLSGDNVCFVEDGLPNHKFDIIADDFNLPSFIPSKYLEKIGLWISQKGTASSIHYDSNGCHNFNAQIKGSKRVILFEPQESKKLYMNSMIADLSFFNFSKVNWQELDYNKFPNIKHVQYVEGILEPGDALFLPVFWLHYFDHLDKINININFWWHPKEIDLNSVSLSWILCIAAAQMITPNHKMLSLRHKNNCRIIDKTNGSIDFTQEEIINFSRKLEEVLNSWNNGRPGGI